MDIRKSPNPQDFGSAPGIEGSSPSHEVTIVSSLDIGKRFALDLTYRYVSALPAQLVEAYSTGDARFGWHVSSHFQLSLVGRNLFQPWHFEYGTDPGGLVGIKRSGYAQLTWTR